MIDEDRSDCAPAPEPEKESEVNYELRLVTNMTTELDTKLSMQTEIGLHHALKKHLEGIFTDFAHDVDLSFYDNKGDSIRLHHDQHIMDASQASYTLNLPKRQYMHLAAANLVKNGQVGIASDEWCHRSLLQQVSGDTIPSHTTGLFSARLPMNVLEGVDQQFRVRLFMVNCAAALVIDTNGLDSRGIQVSGSGFASGFSICDSLYHFASVSPVVRASRIDPAKGSKIAFCTVSFPSREAAATRTYIETTEGFEDKLGKEPVWEFAVIVPNADGTLTRTVLSIREQLSAGELRIIKARLLDNGGLSPDTPDVGVNVALDWKPGNTYTPEI